MIDLVLIDMDGVLVDFARPALAQFGQLGVYDNWPPGEYDIEGVAGVPQDEFWAVLDNEGPEFWAGLPALPWALQLCYLVRNKVLNGFHIATSPSRAPASSMGKVHWLQKFFDPGFRRYMLGSHKHLMAKPGVVLIDDSDEKCEKFIEAGGSAILFPQPWNANHELVRADEQYGGRLDFVKARLAELSN